MVGWGRRKDASLRRWASPPERVLEVQGFVHGHAEDVVDVFFAVGNFEQFFAESLSVAGFAFQGDVCEELHFHGLYAFAFTGFAAAARDVEGKMAG